MRRSGTVVAVVLALVLVACRGGDETATPTSTVPSSITVPSTSASTPASAPSSTVAEPAPGAGELAVRLAGVHVLLQVPAAPGGDVARALAELAAQRPALERALAVPGVVALAVRVPWTVVADDLAVLEAAHAIAVAAERTLTVRFMAGRHTPAAVLDAGPTISVDGRRGPAPFTAQGAPNTAFLDAYATLVARLAAWARANDVPLLHLSHYGLDWAELYVGPAVQALAGAGSADALVAATNALVDIGVGVAGPDLAVELAMSGHGPLMRAADTGPPGIAERITQHVVERVGAGSDRFFVQGNGWDERGIWGAAPPAAARFDAVLGYGASLGVQMIQPGDFAWPAVFAVAERVRATYAEVYLPSFAGAAAAELRAAVAAFNPHLPTGS